MSFEFWCQIFISKEYKTKIAWSTIIFENSLITSPILIQIFDGCNPILDHEETTQSDPKKGAFGFIRQIFGLNLYFDLSCQFFARLIADKGLEVRWWVSSCVSPICIFVNFSLKLDNRDCISLDQQTQGKKLTEFITKMPPRKLVPFIASLTSPPKNWMHQIHRI